MNILERILRPDIAALEAYTPVIPLDMLAERLHISIERLIKLDANENPYGPSPQARAAMTMLSNQELAIYPDPEHTRLRAAISRYTGQPASRIMCGVGSDELIDLIMRVCFQPGDLLIDCPPTFPMYAFNAGILQASVLNVPRDQDFAIDIEGIAEAAERGGKLLFLAAPNNPTGNPLPRAQLMQLLDLPILIVVDEAYAEFSGESVVDLVGSVPNLVVLRTFSKWAGLAGMRIGYALAHEELLANIWKIKQPYNLNVASEAAAIASLGDLDYLRANIARLVAERERLAAKLGQFDRLQVYPSQANFLLCRLHGRGERIGLEVRDTLRKQGILIRAYDRPGLRDCVRFSIGLPEQTDALLKALQEIV